MSEIRVIIADDHPIVLTGIRGCLGQAPEVVVVAETQSGADALKLTRELSPDVLILDIAMPEMTGIEVAQQIRSEKLSTRILILSAYDDPIYVQELVETGVHGYLLKEEASCEIVDAVRGIARGEKGWFSRQITTSVASLLSQNDRQPHNLTGREVEVLEELVSGKTNQEIALALSISEKTVEKHLEGIFKKLQVSSRVEAAVLALKEGMFERTSDLPNF